MNTKDTLNKKFVKLNSENGGSVGDADCLHLTLVELTDKEFEACIGDMHRKFIINGKIKERLFTN